MSSCSLRNETDKNIQRIYRMQKIINTLYVDLIKPFKRHVLVITLVVIFALASYYAYKWFAKSKFEGLTIGGNVGSDVSNYNNRTQEAEIYMFSADWCPHCKKAKPEWEKFKQSFDNKTVGNYTVKVIDVDCTDGNSPLIQQYNVNGYPTVIMKKDGDNISFDSKITNDTLTQFVNSVLQ